MINGRPTLDHKNSPIRVRLNGEMREWLKSKSAATGETISQLIRDAIERSMKTE